MKITIAQLRFWREECEWSYRDISEHTGIPYSTIASRCQKLNLYPKNKVIARDRWRSRPGLQKHHAIDPKLIEELYWGEPGRSTAQVATMLNMPKRSLITVMKFHGIPRRDKSTSRKLAAWWLKQTEPDKVGYLGSIEEARKNGIKSGIVRRERKERLESAESSDKAA